MSLGGQAGFVALALLLVIASLGGAWTAVAAPAQGTLDFDAADFKILNPTAKRVIGHAHYAVEHLGDADLVRGESRYLSGESDAEVDKLELASPGAVPNLVTFEHAFFNADGSPLLVAKADLKSGDASCIHYNRGQAETLTASLDFPPDTYAGASLLIPIEYRLRDNRDHPIRLHAYSCVPGPRLLAIEVRPKSGARWALFAGDVVGVDVRPMLGWWDVLLAPFIPRIRAWFDPADRFSYLGGQVQRFYRGPWVELSRERNNPTSEAQEALPSKRHD